MPNTRIIVTLSKETKMDIPSRLLLCKKCKRFNPQSSLLPYNPRESSLFLVSTCAICHEAWFLCPLHNRRWTARNQYAAVQHFNDPSLSHPVSTDVHDTQQNYDLQTNDNDNNIDEFHLENNDDIQIEQPPLNISHNNRFPFMPLNSQQYFNLYHTKPNQIPAQYLVHSAFAQNSTVSSQFCNLFETEFHLQATRLCLSSSNLQHTQIVTMLHMLESCMSTPANTTKFSSTRLPTTMSDINKFYILKSTSIRKLLPYPKPIELNHHVIVTLKDVLSHMFAYGTTMHGICPYDNHEFTGTYVGDDTAEINNTPFIQNIVNDILQKFPPTENRKPLILFGTVWSDGFDANNVVHSAPSIWIRTITISPPQNMTTSTRHTFVLHMSREGICHNKIDDLFNKELRELENGMWFYSTKLNKSIFVVFKIHVYAADRPERGKLTHVLGHTGVTTKRWMYSAYLPKSNMQSCKACFQYRVKSAKNNASFFDASSRRCGRCADWDFNHSQMKVDLPLGYPESCHKDSPPAPNQRKLERVHQLYPMILSFDNMKASAKFILFNYYKKTFNMNQANLYGRSVGLSGNCIKRTIIAQALDLRAQSTNFTCEELLNKFQYPHSWDSPIQLNQYIDAPMHLIFQGIIKSLIEMISEWLSALSTGESYYKKFCKIIHPLMSSISNMNLSWCFLNTFNTSKNYNPTGWIANNYLAFARLMLIFYRYIRNVIPHTEAGLLECEGMIQSGLCLVSYIMSKHNHDPKPILEYTKLFLSCVDKFESKVYVATSIKPIWRSRGNFLSLLNLALQQQYFGSVRNFWEGERERYIQHIKPLLSHLRHSTSFLLTKLERLYQFIALDYVIESIPNGIGASISEPNYERYTDFIIYKNLETVNKLLAENKPISGIELNVTSLTNNTNSFCVVIKTAHQSLTCYKIVFLETDGYIRCAHFYKDIQLFVENVNILSIYQSKHHLQTNIVDFILLVPNLEKNNKLDYTILTSEWMYLNQDMTTKFCEIQQKLFCEI